MEERLRLAFDAYDVNGDGTIDRNELFNMLRSSCHASGLTQTNDEIWSAVDQAFAIADRNNDGSLDFTEFRIAASRNPSLVSVFWGALD